MNYVEKQHFNFRVIAQLCIKFLSYFSLKTFFIHHIDFYICLYLYRTERSQQKPAIKKDNYYNRQRYSWLVIL